MNDKAHLQVADLVFTRGRGWLSKSIRRFSRTKGEAPTIANHVGIVVAPGNIRTAIIVEALNKVRIHSIESRYLDYKTEVGIARSINITDDERRIVALEAAKYINKRYGYLKLLLHALDRSPPNGKKYFFRRIGGMKRYPICSFHVANAFAKIGKYFGVEVKQAQPDDMADFVDNNPDKYVWVRDFALI